MTFFGTGAAIMFKGSGFYQTDYRSDSYKKAASADSETGHAYASPLARYRHRLVAGPALGGVTQGRPRAIYGCEREAATGGQRGRDRRARGPVPSRAVPGPSHSVICA